VSTWTPQLAPSPAPVPTSILAASARRGREETSKASEAYRRLKGMIVSLELEPASFLDEAELAERLGVGLTPVRQALRRLAWENLVVILPRRGTIVADLNAADLAKIFELRVELEGLAAGLAARRAGVEDLTELDALMRRTEAALDDAPHDHQRLIGLDHELHALLARASHNEMLASTLDWLYSHVLRLWNVSLDRVPVLEGAVRDHVGIAEAVRSGDADTARRRMEAHVQGFQDAFSRI
jgi:DNA-binding GntR family transcriptional regulator